MSKCLYCYKDLDHDQQDYHPKCVVAFYGTKQAPILPYRLSEMEKLAKEAAELSITVPGVQPKLSLGLIKTALENGHKGRLTIMDALEGNYILKPQNVDYPQMPENEHLSMKLAELFKIDIVPVNMIRLQSGELCFITKRIDRNPDGSKNHMIDFLQILELADKYMGTMEKLGKTIGDLSSNTLLDKLRFFESTVFNFIIGNNDMHLKNYSMFLSEMGWVLSPFYDLLNVKMILPKDKEDTALLLGGKKENFNKGYFDRLGAGLKLNDKQINAVYKRLQEWLPKAIQLINISFLDSDKQEAYKKLIAERTKLFHTMTQQQLEKYLWGAATLLRGTIDAGDYKQYIFPLLFFKRICDVYDEEFEKALKESDGDMEYAAFAEHHHFQVPEGAHWNNVRETTTNVGMALQEAMRAIEKANPDTLYGIFGDASWTNKERLSDETLTNLIEHYSQHKLSLSNVADDKLGNAYEYLIKEFADDSGHTAAEFYTNRTVVKLMTLIMDPQPGESVYDPTCGSGGLLLNCALHLKEEGKEYRTLKLYGQEINLLTSAIARMNMFMHGIEEFSIVRGDTLANPAFLHNDALKTFNVILANPPYSIKAWDQKSFANDPYGRNLWGLPPQGCADYAFQQHIHKSMDPINGRYAILWPHGILFRDMEAEMRRKMVQEDQIEAVIGLGANLFYNSPMEAMILVGNNNKPLERKGKVLFINGKDDVIDNKGLAYLTNEHIDKFYKAFKAFEDIPHYAKVASLEEILSHNGNMNINFYVKRENSNADLSFGKAFKEWNETGNKLKESMTNLFEVLQ